MCGIPNDRSLVAGLFQSAGLGIDAAGALADKVMHWREAGPAKQPNGAKEPDYWAAGLSYVPRRGPFQSLDEFKLVMGMTPELYRRIEPALTVYSGRQFLDPQFCPSRGPGGASRPKLGHSGGSHRLPFKSRLPHRRDRPGHPLVGRAFSIRLEIERPHGALTREVVIRLADQPSQPYWLLSWRGK